MSEKVAVLAIGDHLDLAQDVMRLGRMRHMPVLDGNRLVGVVSNRDLLAASLSETLDHPSLERRSHIRSIEIREVMSTDLFTVAPEESLEFAASMMVNHKVGCILVAASDGQLLGLLTETDLIKAAYLTETPEGESMTDLKNKIHEELNSLRQTRDELRLKIHLAKAEGKDLWEQLEHRLEEAESKLKSVAKDAEGPIQDVSDAARLLLSEIRDGYQKIKEAL
jgi:CBS domain-containing protein